MTLTTNRPERVEPGAVLSTDRGALDVTASQPHQHRYLVSFAQIADRDAAEDWAGTTLLAEAIDDPDALWVHEVVGATVVDVDRRALGVVVAVEANPASDLLVLDGGGLVPLRFMIEREPGAIVVDVPEGLVELPEPEG